MFNVGDTIRPINETGEFTIARIVGASVFAEDEHGFENEFLASEIILIRHNLLAEITKVSAWQKGGGHKPKPSKAHKTSKKKQWLEIDLHAGNLLGTTTGMSNHQIVTEQINAARTAIFDARNKGYNFVVLIHGKGTGKLKEELYKMLNQMQRLEFYDADYKSYSSGATEVKLF